MDNSFPACNEHRIRVSTQSRLRRRKFSGRSCRDSNSQPFDYVSGILTNQLSRLPNCACNSPVTWAAVVCLCGLTLCVLCFTVSRQWYGFHCMGLITVCTYVNVCDWGLYVHCQRVSTENCLLEKKLSPYQGVVSCICVSSVLDRCSTN